MFSPQLKNNNNSLHRGIKGVTNKVSIELLNDLNMEKYIKLKLNGRKSIQCWPWFDFKKRGDRTSKKLPDRGKRLACGVSKQRPSNKPKCVFLFKLFLKLFLQAFDVTGLLYTSSVNKTTMQPKERHGCSRKLN